ncbi:MAG TPA: bifunctional 5,10-methylenetetrahydrofolate dehydrogenase/5,10-methenyltetrahydrofolate cyclohydrolase [Candidatus Paceibacterota bacterium]|jgi:methylenetetrahydrofolate dehydrogenase (NADP+)/methenyltetrahydrofolate cyclohydrolase|nr:bifunctional 5,10-methylenetetrahydrofolate dehydrogenase/5,10-methenyltetrahydrofolate cyclohydrolase [Candidatus Paceibacterota bacterium]
MIVDGKALAAGILAKTKREGVGLAHALVVRAIVVQPSPATHSYLRVKSARAEDAGMRMDTVQLPEGATTQDVIEVVQATGADAIIVQLPLPVGFDQQAILDAIPRAADADVLSSEAYAAFERAEDGALLPPVVGAIREVLAHANVDPRGKRVVIVGNGRLVGQPAHAWFLQRGAEAVAVTKETSDTLPALLPHADIVVCGAGSPHLIRPEMVKDGVVLIDAGTSESNGAIVGDIDPACAAKASVFTPVPGGIGPMAVACLFQNAVALAQAAHDALLTNPAA